MTYDYRFLTTEDRTRLRIERVRSLEAEIYRAELALEDALSDAERDSLHRDIALLHQRLLPHYEQLSVIIGADEPPIPDEVET